VEPVDDGPSLSQKKFLTFHAAMILFSDEHSNNALILRQSRGVTSLMMVGVIISMPTQKKNQKIKNQINKILS